MRKATINRQTKETNIRLSLNIDGKGKSEIDSSIGFLDHMLELFAKHGLFDITLAADGDLKVDQHHTVEDIGIVLGRAFSKALKDKKGINRTGFFAFPMDEALAIFAVDIGGRPSVSFKVRFRRKNINDLETDCISEFFHGFANELRANIHVRSFKSRTDHHNAEAIFKSFGKAMKMACSKDKRMMNSIPSTKGLI